MSEDVASLKKRRAEAVAKINASDEKRRYHASRGETWEAGQAVVQMQMHKQAVAEIDQKLITHNRWESQGRFVSKA
jgi:hypothetical protein